VVVILGIVGAEAAKFTRVTEQAARELIRSLLTKDVTSVVSGACHLGGIDIWAIEEAQKRELPTLTFPPRHKSWATGYKPRNIKIAEASDRVVSIVVQVLPADYTGMRFRLCYHCGTDTHVKSGGCWTVKYAKEIGKTGEVLVI
jgi:hypothetical protein